MILVPLRVYSQHFSLIEFVSSSNKQKKSPFEVLVRRLARIYARVHALYLVILKYMPRKLRGNWKLSCMKISLALYSRFTFQNRGICQLFYKLTFLILSVIINIVYTFLYWFRNETSPEYLVLVQKCQAILNKGFRIVVDKFSALASRIFCRILTHGYGFQNTRCPAVGNSPPIYTKYLTEFV